MHYANLNQGSIKLIYIYTYIYIYIYLFTGGLISSLTDKKGKKLQRQKILMFIYPIYNHNWRYINTIYMYNKTSIKRNILTIKQNTMGSTSG